MRWSVRLGCVVLYAFVWSNANEEIGAVEVDGGGTSAEPVDMPEQPQRVPMEQLIAAYGSAITQLYTLQDEQHISYLAFHIYESWAIDFCSLPFEINEHIAKALDRAFSVGVPARHIATGQCSLRNTSKIPMFYINLDHRVDRAANIQKQFEREGLGETFELIRFPAVDGKRRPFTPFEMFTFIEPESLKRYESRARQPVCSLMATKASHYRVWEEISKCGYRGAVILEDDAKFKRGVARELDAVLNSSPEDAAFVFLAAEELNLGSVRFPWRLEEGEGEGDQMMPPRPFTTEIESASGGGAVGRIKHRALAPSFCAYFATSLGVQEILAHYNSSSAEKYLIVDMTVLNLAWAKDIPYMSHTILATPNATTGSDNFRGGGAADLTRSNAIDLAAHYIACSDEIMHWDRFRRTDEYLSFGRVWWNRRCSAEVLDRIEDLLQVKSTLDASTTLPDDLRPYQMFMRELQEARRHKLKVQEQQEQQEQQDQDQRLSTQPKPTSNPIAVLTAVFGNTYRAKLFEQGLSGADYFLFTDNATRVQPAQWKIVLRDYCPGVLDPFFKAKFYKTKWHKVGLFDQYEIVIWMDATLQLKPLHPFDIGALEFDIGAFNHQGRDAIIREVEMSNDRRYAAYQRGMASQIARYSRLENVLFITCFIAMKNNGRVHKVMDRWFDEIMAYSPQDQVSFPYALAAGPWSAPRPRATGAAPGGSLRTATGEDGLIIAQFDDGVSHEETSLYKKHDHPPGYWY
jgi:GR25 family glycosyltransferase involved in LPS biosynthesis